MKINLKKLFVTAIIGGGLFVAQPAQAFYYDTSNIYNYTNDVINTTRNYLLSSQVIKHIEKGNYTMSLLPSIIFSCSLVLYLWKEKSKVETLILF